jgi:hypothetical protein
MARPKNLPFFWAHGFVLRNLRAHYCNMLKARKKKAATAVAQRNIVGEPQSQGSVEDAVRMVRISFVAVTAKIDMVE